MSKVIFAGRGIARTLAAVCLLWQVTGMRAEAASFSNASTITIPATGSGATTGAPASLYPSPIVVSGLSGSIATVSVTLNGYHHPAQKDVDCLLVGPTGATFVFMSDAGGANSTPPTINLTFDDAAATIFPATVISATGTYRPANYTNPAADAFPAPAPGAPYNDAATTGASTFASVFGGTSPNGTWNLYVVDDVAGDVGAIDGGWTLNITIAAAGSPTTTTLISSANPSLTTQAVTLTATVVKSSDSTAAAGSVTFIDNTTGTTLASNVALNGSGVAATTVSANGFAERRHLITATFTPGAGFLASNASLTQTVDFPTSNPSTGIFANTNGITVPDPALGTQGVALVYPSHITVSGFGGAIGTLKVTLSGVSHTQALDFDILLVGPGGQHIVLNSDTGSMNMSNVTATFDDAAATQFAAGAAWGANGSSVTSKPVDVTSTADAWPAPAPAGPYNSPSPTGSATLGSVFGLTNPNGVWSLYVFDDAGGDSGSIAGGWSLTMTAANVAPTITGAVAGQTVNDTATIAPFSGVTIADGDVPAQTLAVSVTLDTAAKGSFTTLNGFSSGGGGVYNFSGTAAAATTAIRGLVFTPAANRVNPPGTETTTFTISANDGIAAAVTNNTTTVISTSVNDAPTIAGAAAGQAVTDKTTVAPFTGVTIADADAAQTQTVSVTLDTAAKGTFTTLNGFTSGGGGVYNFSGTAAAATTAIRGLVFTPAANRVAVGSTETTTFAISVNDGVAAAVTNNTTTVVSTSINDAPTLAGGPFVFSAISAPAVGAGVTVNTILAGATYADVDVGAVKGIAVTASAANGNWQYSTDGTTWTPFGTVSTAASLLLDGLTQVRYAAGANAETATFTFRAWDKTSGTASANGAPSTTSTASTGLATAFSSGTATASITVNANPKITATLAASPSSTSPGGTISYTAKVSNIDTVTKTGTAFNLTLDSNTALVAGTLNASPYTIDQAVTATSGVGLAVTLAAVDPDAGETATLVYSINTPPAHGSLSALTGTPNSSVTYTPTGGYAGPDSFTFKAKDVHNVFSNEDGVVSITVTLPAPVAVADTYQAGRNIALNQAAPGVLGNDTVNFATIASYGASTGNEQTTIGSSTPTAQAGSIVVNSNGSFVYTPANNFTGSDTFKYKLSNSGGSSTATVTITVVAPPVANADPATGVLATPVNQQFARGTPGVLGNDTLNGATITGYGATTGTEQTTIGSATPTAQGGSIVLNSGGNYTFTPKANFSGIDTFKYTITNVAGSSTATVNLYVDVLPTVSSTVPINGATGVSIGTAITINFSEQITTFATFAISPTIAFNQSPTDGNTASTFTLTPTAALAPGQTYTVTVSHNQTADADGGLSMQADFVFSFTTLPLPSALNDPDTQGGRYQVTTNVQIDTALTATPSSILDNDTLNGTTSITFGATGPTSGALADGTNTITTVNGGTVLLRTNGTFTYNPGAGYVGNDSFFYNLNNASGFSRAQVLFSVSGPVVWYVNKSATAGGKGRLADPFQDFANITNDGAVLNNPPTAFTPLIVHPKAGDAFFVFGNAASYNGPFTLLNTQSVFGQAVTGTTFDAMFYPAGVAAYTSIARPSINGTAPTITNATGSGITLGSGNTLNGFNFGNCTGIALSGTNVGTLTVANVTINNATGPGLSLSGGLFAATSAFNSVTSGGGDNGIILNSVGGTVNFGTTTLSGHLATSLLLNTCSATMTFGTTTITNPANIGILVMTSTGQITFGNTTVNKAATAGNGVELGTNSGGITFNTLTVNCGSGLALVAADNTGAISTTAGTGTLTAGNTVVSLAGLSTASRTPLNLSFASVTCSASLGAGFIIKNCSGTFSAAGGSIAAVTGNAFSLAGNTANITYNGSIAKNVLIDTQSGGTVALGGALNLNSGVTGINLTNNTGGTINFTGNITASTGGATAFSATGGGTISATHTSSALATTTATALNINGVNVSGSGLTFASCTSTSGAVATISTSTGTKTLGRISTSSGATTALSLTSAGTVNVGSSNATVSAVTTTTAAAVVLNATVLQLSGSGTGTGLNVTTSGGTGVSVTGGAMDITGGGLAISSGTGAGYAATSGTVTVQGSNNTITSTTGTALNVTGTTIGGSGLTFKSISAGTAASGPANGIILNLTGSSGGLTVTGTGTMAGSGGTIQKCSGDGIHIVSATGAISLSNMNLTNNAQTQTVTANNDLTVGTLSQNVANLYLSSVGSVSLTNLSVSGSTQQGILIIGASGLSLANSTISGNGNQDYEDGLLFKNVTGTITLTNNGVVDNFSREAHVYNDSGTANWTVTGTTFGRTVAPTVSSQQGLLWQLAQTSQGTIDVGTSSFNNNGNGNGLQINLTDSASLGSAGTHSSVHNSVSMTNSAAHVFVNTTGTATAFFDVMNNAVMTNALLQAVDYFAPGGTLTGVVQGNTIGTSGVALSGSSGDGMTIDATTNGKLNLKIQLNTIQQVNTNGIAMGTTQTATLAASIVNNTFRQPAGGANQGNAMLFNVGANNPSTTQAFLTITGNTITDTATNSWDINGSGASIYFNTKNATLTNLPGYAGGATSDTNFANFVNANNTITLVFPGALKTLATRFNGSTYGGASSPLPAPLLFGVGGIESANAASINKRALTQAQLDGLVFTARAQWEATGLTDAQRASLQGVRFEVGNLGPWRLGEAGKGVIRVDAMAGGHGWYVGKCQMGDSHDVQFCKRVSATRFYTTPDKDAAGRIDLLTTIMHEMGHALGLPDRYKAAARDSIMYGYLTKGERRLPSRADFQSATNEVPFIWPSAKGAHALPGTDVRAIDSRPRDRDASNGQSSAGPTKSTSWVGGLKIRPTVALLAFGMILALALGSRFTRHFGALTIGVLLLSGSAQAATVTENIGNLPPGKSTTITFSATVANPTVPVNAPTVSQQGQVTATNITGTVLTNDPATVATLGDPTLTTIVHAPAIASITPPANGSYRAGQNLDFTLNWSSTVTISGGMPSLGVVIGATTKNATYVSGSGSAATLFRYTVLAGDNDADGIALVSPLALNGATIQDASSNNAILTFTPPNTTGVLVDTVAPTILSVTAPANGSYRAGQALNFTVNFGESVNVGTAGGTPSLSLTIGTTARNAAYVSGGGTNALLFRYTIAAGETDLNGIATASPLALNGGSIADLAGNAATLTFGPPDTTGVFVDTTAPTIDFVAGPPNGSYGAGAQLNFRVSFNELVTVSTAGGTPTLSLTVGAAVRNASFVSVNGIGELVFRYIVAAGENDTDGIVITSPLVLNGGTINDAAGNPATLTFTPPSTTSVLVDTTIPTITSVVAPANKTYVQGENIDFTVNFSEPVNIAGTPQIPVTIGATAKFAAYASGSGTASPIFRVTVASGDLDGDGIVTASPVALNGGTIRDAAGNNSTLTFTPPNTTGVLVDGIVPTITNVTPPANAVYSTGQAMNFTFTFSEAVAVDTTNGTPAFNMTVGTATRNVLYVSGGGTTQLVFRHNVFAGDNDADGVTLASTIALFGGTIKDLPGNNAVLTFTPPNTTGVKVDTIPPSLVSINRQTPAGPQTNATSVTYAVTFSESVASVDAADFSAVTTGSVGFVPPLVVSGSGLNYTVTVNGIGGTGTLRLDAVDTGTVFDVAGNALSVGQFPISSAMPVTNPSRFIVARDFNGDGKADLAVASSGSLGGTVGIFLGRGDGTFQAPTSYATSSNLDPKSIAVGDLNGDGKPDLAVACTGGLVTILLGNGDGTFQTGLPAAGASGEIGIAIADLNGDGKPDLITTNSTSNTVNVVLNTGGGVFGSLSTTFVNGFSPIAVAAGDLNGDGKADVVTANNLTGNLSILLGNGSGGFGTPTFLSTGGQPLDVAIVDVNGDGRADIVASNSAGVKVFLGIGNGTFQPPTTISFNAYRIAAGDMNGDGRLDLVLGGSGTTVGVLTGDGGGAFTGPQSYAAGPQPNGVALADFNGDGKPDIATLNLLHAHVSVLLNSNGAIGQTYTIDTVAPTISSITSPASGYYLAGQALDFTANFSENVTVVTTGGTPRLSLTVGAAAKNALYVSGSGTNALLFRYTVAVGDNDSDGIVLASPLNLNGGTILDATGNNALLTFTPPNTAGVLVDGVQPTITSSTVPANGIYTTGQALNFTVTYNEIVIVNTAGGTPRLNLIVGGILIPANYVSGSGSATLVFRYTVQAGDNDANGISIGFSPPSATINPGGGTIKDAAGNDAAITFTSPSTTGVLVDTGSPAISGVTAPANGSYRAGQNLDFIVTFNENVTVTGAPSLSITLGASAKNAVYVSGTGTSALLFRYTVAAGDNDSDGIANASPLVLNGGTIKDGAGNDATLTFTPPNTTGVIVDTTAPAITSVTAPANGSYRAGQNLDFTATFSENVLVVTTGGTPGLSLTVGASAKTAAYLSGSGTNVLVFRYTVAAGDTDTDGIASGSPLVLNGGTINDSAGNASALTFTAPNTAGVLVDTTVPEVLTIHGTTPNSSLTNAASVTYTVVFSEPVNNVTAADFFTVVNGVTTTPPLVVSGSGANYTVTVNGISGDGTLGLNLINAQTIKDAAGNTLSIVPKSEVQTVTVGGAVGTFTLTFNGQTTSALASTATATAVQNALQSLSTVGTGNVSVTQQGNIYSITFQGSLANQNVAQITASGSPGVTASGATLNDGVPAGTNFYGNTYTIDQTGPAITLNAPSQLYVNSTGAYSYGVSATDPHLAPGGDVNPLNYLVTTGTAAFQGTSFFSINNSTNIAILIGGQFSGDGTVKLVVPAGILSDTLGNLSLAAGPTQTVTVDNTLPAITISAPSVSNTLNGPVSWTVTYNDANFNASTLASGDITLNTSPGVNVGTIQVSPGTGNTRTVTLDTITGFGTLGFSINAGTATDLAGNVAAAGGPSPTVQVNSPPTIAGTVANQAANDNATILPFAGVTIADVDLPAQTLAISFTLDDTAKGTITTLNGFTDAGGGMFTFSGDAAAATAALQGVVFTPAPNRLPVGATETLNIALSATDNFSPVTLDNTTSIVITSANDAPASVQIAASAAAITENVSLTVNGTFADADTQDAHSISIDWGDGTAPSIVPLSPGVFAFSASHTYLNNPAQDSYTITATVTDGSNASASAQIGVDTLPAFLSGPTATPNPAVVDLAVSFSVTAKPADALVTWNFGDGTTSATGANVSHIYTAAGTYTVTVSAQNPRTGTATNAALTLDVSDVATIPNTLPMRLTRGFIRFGVNADRVGLQSVIQLAPGQAVAGQTLTVSINGLTRTFALDSRGNAVTPEARVHLRVFKFTVNGAQAKLTLSLKGQLRASLSQGATLDANGNPKKAAITLGVGTKLYSDVKPLVFKRNTARFGFAH